MKTTNSNGFDDMSVERGRRLVQLAFSPDHQRLRSPGDITPLIKRVTTADRSHCGGFHPTQCHAPAQKPAKYSQPVMSRIEGVGSILREIRSLPAFHQIWLEFQYRQVSREDIRERLYFLFCGAYRHSAIRRPIRAGTLVIVDIMILEHLKYLTGMDKPAAQAPQRQCARDDIASINADVWKKTYGKHWKSTYNSIVAIDAEALRMLDEAI